MQSEIGRLASIISRATATLDASESVSSGSLHSFKAESPQSPPQSTEEEVKATHDAINARRELLD